MLRHRRSWRCWPELQSPYVITTLSPSTFPCEESGTNAPNTAATTPANVDDFISGCAAVGQQAKCCVVPVANQDVLCQDVSGSGSGGGAPSATPTSAAGGSAPTSAPGGGGAASSTSCESSAAVTTTAAPTKPAPTKPAATSDCGCGE